ncbi:MAG: DNA gyrase subunit A [Acidobacteriota bacterium]|nr:DNA gyrase subunit A [Blastocatellia bacterium]MDW8241481.1 DNA gyrase subunit A [Acidobacteriota bacterium]
MEAKKFIQVALDEEMRRSYLDYAMSVIIGRALPDVRDGFKPVHRRILWAMHELGNTHNKPHKKSARVVGDVIGKYHPHGDSAVYEAMVRLVQPFSLRYPILDGQGNWGSIDADEPAAMRYTEVRMGRLATQILADIEKETVDFQPNYDESLQEPVVLPVRFPNLLVNGASGIAVGMATNIPPHNLGEIIDATIYLIEHPDADIKTLMKFVPGPDFPTGGFIYGRAGIRQAYHTGRGTIIMRARAAIDKVGRGAHERDAIVVTEIPYQVIKAKLVEKIAELVNERKLDGIADLRDESDREGMRIVIELKRDAIPQIVLNNLYKLTPMQSSFGVINLSIVNGQPQVLNLKQTLEEFISFRREVVRRRTVFELNKAEARAHILEGLKRAIDQIDAVIGLIRAAKSTAQARSGLMEKFQFSEKQAQAILDMQLQRLTGLERQKLVDEYQEIIKKIAELKEILANEMVLRNVIVEELQAVRKEFADARRTQIVDEEVEFALEDLIPDEEVVITVTHAGFIKRTPLAIFRSQTRGGKGRSGISLRGEDFVTHVFVATTHSYIMIFTNQGKVYNLKVHEIPEAQAASRGRAIASLAHFSSNEKVAGVIAVRDFPEDRYVVMVSRKGIIKKTRLSEFDNLRASGLIAASVESDDELISAELTDGTMKIFLATHDGQAICFDESDVRAMGRQARGVRGIALSPGDYVVSVCAVTGDEQMLSITERGYGKQTALSEYRVQSRGGKGVINVKVTEKTGHVVAVMPVKTDDEVMLMSHQGKALRLEAADIRETGRNAQGVRVITLEEGDKVASAALAGRGQEDVDRATDNKTAPAPQPPEQPDTGSDQLTDQPSQ